MNDPANAPVPNAALQALQQENRRLNRAVEELSFLNDLARAIGASTNLQEIMQTIVHRSLHAIHAEQGVITLVEATAKNCLSRANKLLCQSTDKCNFITFFYAVLDHQTHQLSYASAGHNPPFLISAGKSYRQLERRGLVLGIRDQIDYEEETLALQTSDLLVIYSDGIIEAMNNWQEEFGEERLLEVVMKNRQEKAGALIEKIVHAVKQHAGQAAQSDDITLVVLKKTS